MRGNLDGWRLRKGQEGGIYEKMELVEEEEEAELFMISNISYIQAFRFLSRTMIFKGIDMKVIWELWYRNCRNNGLNIPGYTMQYISCSPRVE